VNTLLGIAHTSGKGPALESLRALSGSAERGTFLEGELSSPDVSWASTSNGGVVIGKARSGRNALAYLGNFHGPFPDSSGGGSLDVPNRTAQALLRRYESHGSDFLRDLCGHFAVLVVEPAAHRVLLARGHGSATRWFYAESAGRLAFSTRLADLPSLEPGARLDRSMEDFLLGYEFLPQGYTPFQGVRTLLPGKILSWQNGALEIGDLALPRPWGKRFDSIDYEDEDQVVDSLHEAFELAVADQAPKSGKVGVLLGGVDSALVAVTLKRLGKDVHTFSFRYEDRAYNQAYTEELGREFDLAHHWIPITPAVLEDGLRHYAQRFNQTLSQPHYVIATAEVCRAIREQGILHCLTGDGCDGLFLGYPTVHLRAKLIQGLSRGAPMLSRSIDLLTRSEWLERKLGHPYRVGRNVGRILGRPMPARGHIAACTLDRVSLEALRGPAPPQRLEVEEILEQMALGLESTGTIRLAYLGKSRVGLNGVKLDGAMSYAGISVNSPYLHPGLESVAKRIPDSLNRPDRKTRGKSMGKYAFLKMIEKHALLPRPMVYQPKRSPVMAPVDLWYWGELRRFMLSRFEQLPFRANPHYLESLLLPKVTEKLFRNFIGISRHVTQVAGILATYAAYAELENSTTRGAMVTSPAGEPAR
jgi:hypothetical protein